MKRLPYVLLTFGFFAGGLTLAGPCAAAAESSAGRARRPDVLFIAVDDLNDWVACLGGRRGMHTPNIDRLAARGVLFTNAHCAAPSCNPSRVAVMTGIRPSTSGIYHNGQEWRKSPRLATAQAIPEYFRSQGYFATGGGKLFHALSWIQDRYGRQQNDPNIWDEYFPSKTRPMPESVWPVPVTRSETGYISWEPVAKGKSLQGRPPHFFDWGPLAHADGKMADAKVVDWAASELARARDKPRFLAVGIFRPHIPWFVPQKYFDLYPLEDVFLPKVRTGDLDDCSEVGRRFCRRAWQRWLVQNDAWRGAVRGYLASISFADAQVGRLIDALDAGPGAKNTVVVLWSDHGMHIGEKEHWEKFTLWEESTRVPLIVVAPGVTQPGTRCGEAVSLLDVYPTLVELCGLVPKRDLQGQSLVPLLRDPKSSRERPAVTTWGRGNHAVRTERWRYIQYHNGDEELYDHENDSGEFTNLAGQEEYDEVKRELSAWIPTENAAPVRNESVKR